MADSLCPAADSQQLPACRGLRIHPSFVQTEEGGFSPPPPSCCRAGAAEPEVAAPALTPAERSEQWVPAWAGTLGVPEFLQQVGAVTGEAWLRLADALRNFSLSGGAWRVSVPDSHVSLLFSFYRHQFVENNLILKMGPVDKRKVSPIPAAPPRVSVSPQLRQGLALGCGLRLTPAACVSFALVPFL